MLWLGVLWVAFIVLTAIAAQSRGRSAAGWAVLGAVFGLFALIAVLVIGEKAQPVEVAQDDLKPLRFDRVGGASTAGRAAPPVQPMRLDSVADEEFDQRLAADSLRTEAVSAIVANRVLPARVWSQLVADRDNGLDPNAVRVEIDGRTVGFLPRESARLLAEAPAEHRARVLAAQHPALIVGSADAPVVRLHLRRR